MKSTDIEKFVNKNISNFHINGSGWKRLISDMLFEFCIAGWNVNNIVGGKEKFGGLRCNVICDDQNLERNIHKIIQKYQLIASKTCEYCGNPGKLRAANQWEFTACKQCYLNKGSFYSNLSILNPSECKSCGYFAIEDGRCMFCFNEVYDSENEFLEFYKSEKEYLIETQIEIFIDLDNDIELAKKIRPFKKSENHEIVFTIEDLKNYIQRIESS